MGLHGASDPARRFCPCCLCKLLVSIVSCTSGVKYGAVLDGIPLRDKMLTNSAGFMGVLSGLEVFMGGVMASKTYGGIYAGHLM